jgi:membrane glycosyltransferase
MADLTITVPEPSGIDTDGISVTIQREDGHTDCVVLIARAGVRRSTSVDLAALTAAQRLALRQALAPVVAAAWAQILGTP